MNLRPTPAVPGIPGPAFPMWIQTALYGLRPVPFLEWCQRRYGDRFAIRLPAAGRMVVLGDPEAIREVSALEAGQFSAASAAPLLEPFLGPRSLLLQDGERHQRERKMLAHSFHAGAMSDYEQVIVDATRRDMEDWPLGAPFALHSRFQAITLDVIVRLVFGADDPARRQMLVDALRPWLRQGGSVLLLVESFRRDFGGRSPWAKFVTQRGLIDRLLDDHINARRGDPRLGERRDVLSRLLQAERDGAGFTDPQSLRDQLMTMLAAGHDTSATALAWAFVLVLRHRDVLERLRAEIETGETAYLDAVVKESLRLCPVVLEFGRTLTADTVIHGATIPAGVGVTPSILLAQRRADRYPDPRAFRPERFIDQPVDPHSWLPFGTGIRRCLGAAFATLEIKTVLRTVIAEADLAPVGRMERPRRRAVTMIPSRGARVVMEARREIDHAHADRGRVRTEPVGADRATG